MKKLFALAAGAAALVTLAAQPASANAQAECDMQDGLVCLWNIKGELSTVPSVPSGQCRNTVLYYEIRNWSGRYARAWEGKDCTGRNQLVSANDGQVFLNWGGGAWSLGGL
ncbi:hypothetical protein AB5J62_36925 [Amycolatopsis sp. cg5]|uniref:hypothetical protein n=1 Tax=Amycolatopsis sp. cg5 TaxID=3238802 RepID=UPI00352479EC